MVTFDKPIPTKAQYQAALDQYAGERMMDNGLDFWNDPRRWDGITDTHKQMFWMARRPALALPSSIPGQSQLDWISSSASEIYGDIERMWREVGYPTDWTLKLTLAENSMLENRSEYNVSVREMIRRGLPGVKFSVIMEPTAVITPERFRILGYTQSAATPTAPVFV